MVGPWVQMVLSPDDRQLAVQRDNTIVSGTWLFDLPAGTVTTSFEAKLLGKNVDTVLIWNGSRATRCAAPAPGSR
ncbi:MAG TPA: hypothetical protein VMW48_14600 [Vicinamibacterales bacterium]|nr:hypothetical protein [Vicinamibacterales bacterium]